MPVNQRAFGSEEVFSVRTSSSLILIEVFPCSTGLLSETSGQPTSKFGRSQEVLVAVFPKLMKTSTVPSGAASRHDTILSLHQCFSDGPRKVLIISIYVSQISRGRLVRRDVSEDCVGTGLPVTSSSGSHKTYRDANLRLSIIGSKTVSTCATMRKQSVTLYMPTRG